MKRDTQHNELNAEGCNPECRNQAHYAEFHNVGCCYAECRGAVLF